METLLLISSNASKIAFNLCDAPYNFYFLKFNSIQALMLKFTRSIEKLSPVNFNYCINIILDNKFMPDNI